MLQNDNFIKFEILKWLGNNEWLNTAPAHDFSMDYFYNFFSNKIENLTRLHLEKLLRELKYGQLVELELYPDNRVHIVRGLSIRGARWIELHNN